MKNLIHVLLAILPAAAFADAWVESGRPPGQPPAAIIVTNPPAAVVVTNEISVTVTNIQVGGGAADNLGDHTATGALNMASFGISNAGPVSITGGGMSGGYALRAIYGGPGAFDMIQMAGGSPYDEVGLWPWGAMDGNVLAYSSLYDAWVPSAGGGGSGDDLGNHTATQPLNLQANGITNASDIFLAEGLDSGWTLGAQYGGPAAYYQAEFAGGSPADVVGFYPWNPSDGDVLTYSAANDTWQPAAAVGGGGNTLFGNDASDPNSGQDVFIRAGSVRDPFTLMGLPGTTFIQGSTNGVSAKQGGIVISTTGGSGPDALSGGDITIQSGNGGAMGGEPGYVRILAGAAQGLIGPQFLIGNATAGTLIQSDGTNLVMSHAGGRFAIMASTEESTRWLVIQDQSTTLILSNGTVSVDGNLCVDGQPTSGQVPVFTKGFCTGFVTP